MLFFILINLFFWIFIFTLFGFNVLEWNIDKNFLELLFILPSVKDDEIKLL